MEVWFRSFSFLFMGDGCRFQPLIFQGVGLPNHFPYEKVVYTPKKVNEINLVTSFNGHLLNVSLLKNSEALLRIVGHIRHLLQERFTQDIKDGEPSRMSGVEPKIGKHPKIIHFNRVFPF